MQVGFACGVFDVFHIGHVLMLEECKVQCDYLVVAVNEAKDYDPVINPGKNRPIFPLDARVKVLESCRFVDEVISYNGEEQLIALLMSGRFHIRFIGDDYKGKPITAPDAPLSLFYVDRSHGWSTTLLKKRLIDT